jgi:hypothetical protein
MLTIMRRLEAIDLSRPAALLRLPQPGRSCQPDIAVASTTIDPLAGDRGFESTSLQRRESCANRCSTRARPGLDKRQAVQEKLALSFQSALPRLVGAA